MVVFGKTEAFILRDQCLGLFGISLGAADWDRHRGLFPCHRAGARLPPHGINALPVIVNDSASPLRANFGFPPGARFVSVRRIADCYANPGQPVRKQHRMKRALVIAAAISLLLPGLSIAQPDQRERAGSGAPSAPGNRPGAPPTSTPGNRPGAPPNRPGNPGRQSTPNRPGRPSTPPRPQPPRPQPPRPQPPRPQPPRPHPAPPHGGRPGYHRPPPFAQPLPPRGNQFWHRGNYFNRLRGPAFAYPPGWYYRRWAIGAVLPPLFLSPAYFYPGWAALGLEPPPPGYAWVRFGPDLLEVNLSTGEVEDGVYGVFY